MWLRPFNIGLDLGGHKTRPIKFLPLFGPYGYSGYGGGLGPIFPLDNLSGQTHGGGADIVTDK